MLWEQTLKCFTSNFEPIPKLSIREAKSTITWQKIFKIESTPRSDIISQKYLLPTQLTPAAILDSSIDIVVQVG